MYKRYSIFISKKIRDFHLEYQYDDVFEESLLLLNKAIDKYIDSEIPFYSYFMRMLTNMLSTFYSKNKKRRDFIIDNYDFLYENNTEVDDEYDLNMMIESNLDQKEKTIMNLYYFEKWSVKRIAEEFDYTIPHVYYTLKIIKEKLSEN